MTAKPSLPQPTWAQMALDFSLRAMKARRVANDPTRRELAEVLELVAEMAERLAAIEART